MNTYQENPTGTSELYSNQESFSFIIDGGCEKKNYNTDSESKVFVVIHMKTSCWIFYFF